MVLGMERINGVLQWDTLYSWREWFKINARFGNQFCKNTTDFSKHYLIKYNSKLGMKYMVGKIIWSKFQICQNIFINKILYDHNRQIKFQESKFWNIISLILQNKWSQKFEDRLTHNKLPYTQKSYLNYKWNL